VKPKSPNLTTESKDISPPVFKTKLSIPSPSSLSALLVVPQKIRSEIASVTPLVLFVLTSVIDTHLLQHPVAKLDQKISKNIEKAVELLCEAYMQAGAKM
jgi:hypothetical protein